MERLAHDKLKSHLKETIHKAFNHRNYGSKFVVLGYNSTYFSNKMDISLEVIWKSRIIDR
jgi:membrane protease subunit (stomatin/prohibitin family)